MKGFMMELRPEIKPLAVHPAVIHKIVCPVCHEKLRIEGENFLCENPDCGDIFPVVQGVPVLIHEKNSIFKIDYICKDIKNKKKQAENSKLFLHKLSKAWPNADQNLKVRDNFKKLVQLLQKNKNVNDVLVIGGGEGGVGFEILKAQSNSIRLTDTDVVYGTRTQLICDAHDIPFSDQSFEAVVIQAVLEHVVNPERCVREIHRVLKKDGLVYSDTPFIQQVHMGAHDFTRYTHLGHRRLFRQFEEISSGPSCGPGMALAWSFEYFVTSFFRNKWLIRMTTAASRLMGFWLRFFDRYLIHQPGAFDSASSTYFMGRKSDVTVTDRDVLTQYGGNHAL